MNPNDKLCFDTSWLNTESNQCLLLSLKALDQAAQSPDRFAELCFADPAGQPLRQGQVHRDLQAFLGTQRRALVELPRDHGKSIQACIRALWELGHNPALRITVVCASDARAAERCRFLRDAVTNNPLVPLVFPLLLPARPWQVTQFTLQRPGDAVGASVTAFGVGSASTGTRCDLMICDDLVDVRALRSRADRERVKAFFYENLVNQLEPDGRLWCLFTPWHVEDLNSELKRNPAYVLFRRPVGDDLQPVWLERWPRERLEERRAEIGTVAFTRAYRLACVPDDEVPIKASWLRYWLPGDVVGSHLTPPAPLPCQGRGEERYLTSPALLPWQGRGEEHCSPLPRNGGEGLGVRGLAGQRDAYELVVLAVDPAVSRSSGADASALVTLGKTEANEVHCLEATARRVGAPELLGLIDDADRRWRPDVILFESNAAFAGVRELLARQAAFGPKVKSVVQTKDKMSRVHAFSVVVENGTFRLKGLNAAQVDPSQQALWDELTTFPVGEHDDLLDAAMFGAAHLLDRPEPRIW